MSNKLISTNGSYVCSECSKKTMLSGGVGPKLVPLIVTNEPKGPISGVTDVIVGI